MLAVLARAVDDFRVEVDYSHFEKSSKFEPALQRTLSSLTLLEEAFLDGVEMNESFVKDLVEVLNEAATEIGFLLWSQKHESSINERIRALLVRTENYKTELECPLKCNTKGSFRLPLFSRSDSFRHLDYIPKEERSNGQEPIGHVKRIAMKMQKEVFQVTAEFTKKNIPSPPKNTKGGKKLLRKSSSLPPPPPPSVRGKFARQKSEITRQPKVIRLFHSFQSSSVDMVSLPRSYSLKDSSTRVADPAAVIGELMAKSKHAQKINEEAAKCEKDIKNWAEEIKTTSFQTMNQVHEFVRKMDQNINQNLTDETIILKKFDSWPLRYDVMREASARWKQLKELEANLREWNPSDRLGHEKELKRMRDYMDRVDYKLQDLLRTQSAEEMKYYKYGLPWPSDIFDQVKCASLVLLHLHMKLTLQHVKTNSLTIHKTRNLLSSCACFAFKVHQLVGGFNDACKDAFSEIEKVAQAVIKTVDRVEPRTYPFSQTPCHVANC